MNEITRLEMTQKHGDMPSRDQPITGVQFFNVLLHVLGQIRCFMLGKNAQQRAQLQPPVLHRYAMPAITQQLDIV